MQPAIRFKFQQWRLWAGGLGALGLLGTIVLVIPHPAPAPKVDLAQDTTLVRRQDLVVQVQANGVVQPLRKVNLAPKEAGKVAALFVREGDRVQPGQVVAQMDGEQLQAQVKQSQAGLARSQAELQLKLAGNRPEDITKAQAEVQRQQAQLQEAEGKWQLATQKLQRRQLLANEGVLSQDALDETLTEARNASATVEQAKASLATAEQEFHKQRQGFRAEEVAQARAQVVEARSQLQVVRIQLQNTLIRSPFGGVITRRFADVGDFVAPTTTASSSDGATSAAIAELFSGLEVEAKIPETAIGQIRQGQAVEIRSDSYPDRTFQGRVKRIAPRAVPENNVTTFRIKVSLRTGLDILKAGMNVKLAFLGQPIRNALVVPLAALVTQKDGRKGVWRLVPNQEARFQTVEIGAESGSQAQVRSGLQAGDRILLSPPINQVIPGVDNPEGSGF